MREYKLLSAEILVGSCKVKNRFGHNFGQQNIWIGTKLGQLQSWTWDFFMRIGPYKNWKVQVLGDLRKSLVLGLLSIDWAGFKCLKLGRLKVEFKFKS
ncbi:hypothetical protein HanHA300_Chr12g0440481 [Helianthus annuus]|nr:hypothetical protein HanHA300_Chr12g0440481 [Helianthus annuus]KAJ0505008.1 hypothetical protein HanHA89_Chr12g0465591 [Helianthus annuus]KAJ0674691.1 hypothetical protein HanLR1_Chr12g0442711 [Helianthus annuus]